MDDRIPTPGQEGRVLITPENGSAPFYAIIEMADNPTQVGTPLNKASLLSDQTENMIFGSADDRTVDDALFNLGQRVSLLMEDAAGITVTVQTINGTKLKGVSITNVFDETGNYVVTDVNGQASGYIAAGSSSIEISGYGDIEDYSETIETEKGQTYTKTVNVTLRNFLKITSTRNVRFSENVTQVDVSAIGGGGGGAYGTYYNNEQGYSTTGTGGGGGGGNVATQENVPFTPNVTYTAVIGAGGAVSSYAGTYPNTAETGGTSSLLGVSAVGGAGGSVASGGAGNGNGGGPRTTVGQGNNGGAGTSSIFSSFTETEIVGGGGGGGAMYDQSTATGYNGGAGGSPNGGEGGDGVSAASADASPGQVPGGGGGGGGFYYRTSGVITTAWGKPAPGGAGAIAIRMHLASAA